MFGIMRKKRTSLVALTTQEGPVKGGLLIAGVGVTRSRRSRGRMISHAAAARRLASQPSMLCSSLCLMIMNIAVDILLRIASDLNYFTCI